MKTRSPLLLLIIVLVAIPTTPVLADLTSWTSYGPYGGLVRTMAVSPVFTDDHIVLAGTETGGLFISQDGATTWQTVDGLPIGLTISSIAISPQYAEDHTLFISTTAGGIFKSSDGGTVWKLWSDGLTTLSVAQMALSPDYANDQTLIAATNRGIYASNSAGKTWYATGPRVTTLSTAIHSDQVTQATIYAGTVIGLYVSRNGGETWNATDLNGIPVISIALSPNYATDGCVLVGTLQGAFMSIDGGQTWNSGWQLEQAIRHTFFSPHYASDSTLFMCGDDGLHVSGDDGNTWTITSGIQDGVNVLIAPPDSDTPLTLFAGTDHNGVYRSRDGGTTWTAENTGLSNLGLDAVAVSSNYKQDRVILAGGESGAWISQNDGLHWQTTDLTYAQVNALEYSQDTTTAQTAYAATNGGVFTSIDSGLTWSAMSNGLGVLNTTDIAVGTEGVLWVATSGGGVYHMENGGTLWTSRSEGLGSAYVTSIEWLGSHNGGEWLIAGTAGDGIYTTSDGGQHWMSATSPPDTPLINALASATGYADTPVAFAGTTAGAFLSIDRGDTWDFKGLLGLDIQTVALHPNYASRPNCYIGTADDGIMRSLNGGLRWQAMNSGLTAFDVRDLIVATSDVNPTLFAVTRSGMWRYGSLPAPPEPESPTHLYLPLVQRSAMHTLLMGDMPDPNLDTRPERRARSIGRPTR